MTSETKRGGGASRRIDGIFSAETLADAISRVADAWFWLDGDGALDGDDPVHRFGIAQRVITAASGDEDAFLEALRPRRDGTGTRSAGLPVSGWLPVFGYEYGLALAGNRVRPSDGSPAFALRIDVVVELRAREAEAGQTELRLRAAHDADIDAWLEAYAARVLEPARQAASRSHANTVARATPDGAPRFAVQRRGWNRSDAAYKALVAECIGQIRQGTASVLCLTDRFEAEVRSTSGSPEELSDLPLDLFRALRQRGSAARGAIIVAGDIALVSASPERFLRVRDRKVSTWPMKGTRPRGATPEKDAEARRELVASAKERAENLAVVDVVRAEMSRVCTDGSVRAASLLAVETHPHVHQLVSRIDGTLAPENDWRHMLRACLPGASMTGVPKAAALQILETHERHPRGLYSGCFGWIDDGGDAELAMTIRSFEMHRRGPERATVTIGAGGGVTAQSDPRDERRERDLKAAPLLNALEQACQAESPLAPRYP